MPSSGISSDGCRLARSTAGSSAGTSLRLQSTARLRVRTRLVISSVGAFTLSGNSAYSMRTPRVASDATRTLDALPVHALSIDCWYSTSTSGIGSHTRETPLTSATLTVVTSLEGAPTGHLGLEATLLRDCWQKWQRRWRRRRPGAANDGSDERSWHLLQWTIGNEWISAATLPTRGEPSVGGLARPIDLANDRKARAAIAADHDRWLGAAHRSAPARAGNRATNGAGSSRQRRSSSRRSPRRGRSPAAATRAARPTARRARAPRLSRSIGSECRHGGQAIDRQRTRADLTSQRRPRWLHSVARSLRCTAGNT